MSAYIVSNPTINAIVTFAAQQRVIYRDETGHAQIITPHNAGEIGRMLMDENVRSVVCRYQASSPDFADECKNAAGEYVYKPFPTPVTAVEIIKLCNCVDYQSCETDDWETTIAWRILQAVIASAISGIPGWDTAPWGLASESDPKLKHAGQVSLMSLMRRS